MAMVVGAGCGVGGGRRRGRCSGRCSRSGGCRRSGRRRGYRELSRLLPTMMVAFAVHPLAELDVTLWPARVR